MQCPSCGAFSDDSECCVDHGTETIQIQNHNIEAEILSLEIDMNSPGEVDVQMAKRSTLIEFPGLNRTPMPEWRKELSERVREVQERRAREAAELEQQNTDDENSTPQLELLPPAEVPAMNPLVAAALRRIERAHQSATTETRQSRGALATAVAYAPAREEQESEVITPEITSTFEFNAEVDSQLETATDPPQSEKTHNLVVICAEEPEALKAPLPAPKRLIYDNPNDPALNYLDAISREIRVEEMEPKRPAAFRRLLCGLFDLVICGLLTAPIALAMNLTGTDLSDPRAIEVLAGSFVVATFIYITLSTALTGRTWAMRLLKLRVIDIKTGLIPTGRQSISRSFLYLISLALAGIGILFALVSREGETLHDRITRTAVIGT